MPCHASKLQDDQVRVLRDERVQAIEQHIRGRCIGSGILQNVAGVWPRAVHILKEGDQRSFVLATAIQCRNVAGAKKLLAAGANPNLATGSPKILPLHFAVQTGQLSVVRKLIQTGADIDAPSVDMKMTALHYACLQDRWDIN